MTNPHALAGCLAFLLATLLVAGCGPAASGDSLGGVGGSRDAAAGAPALSPACAEPAALHAPLRRITRFEYNNTVRDWFGVQTRPADALPGEELGNGFGNDADSLGVSRLLIDGYRSVAQQLAKEVTADVATTVAFAGCDPVVVGDEACSQSFLKQFLLRAFRRPAEAEDLTTYAATLARGRELGGFASAVRAVVERALQAPQFLYRVELGDPIDAARHLSRPKPYEMATRLSYLLWGSLPDQALFDAAEQGRLASKAGVLAEARRLLADARAREVVSYFHGMLLGTRGLDQLERDPELYPAYERGMGALFRQETERFLDDVVWNGTGDLSGILTAPYSFVNGPLAQYYGLPGVSGDTFQKVDVNPTQRRGLLTQASILSLTTSGSRTDPVARGQWVYSKLLCSVAAMEPPPDVAKLLGLGFEHYDGAGLWRDRDNGRPVNDLGDIVAGDVAGAFRGVIELGQQLAQSRDVRRCFVGHWLAYAYGRRETHADICTRFALETAFEQSGGNVQALLLALTQTDAFLYRRLVLSSNYL